jgi:hypothetical protein
MCLRVRVPSGSVGRYRGFARIVASCKHIAAWTNLAQLDEDRFPHDAAAECAPGPMTAATFVSASSSIMLSSPFPALHPESSHFSSATTGFLRRPPPSRVGSELIRSIAIDAAPAIVLPLAHEPVIGSSTPTRTTRSASRAFVLPPGQMTFSLSWRYLQLAKSQGKRIEQS